MTLKLILDKESLVLESVSRAGHGRIQPEGDLHSLRSGLYLK